MAGGGSLRRHRQRRETGNWGPEGEMVAKQTDLPQRRGARPASLRAGGGGARGGRPHPARRRRSPRRQRRQAGPLPGVACAPRRSKGGVGGEAAAAHGRGIHERGGAHSSLACRPHVCLGCVYVYLSQLILCLSKGSAPVSWLVSQQQGQETEATRAPRAGGVGGCSAAPGGPLPRSSITQRCDQLVARQAPGAGCRVRASQGGAAGAPWGRVEAAD